MARARVIPVLLLRNTGLVKTIKFKDAKYVGDPINAVKIFNDKEVDELIFLDITATPENKKPNLQLLREIAEECFMPLCYGGGVKTLEDIKSIIQSGVEKVAINTTAIEDPLFIKKAADAFGSSTIVVGIDIKKNMWGKYQVFSHGGGKKTDLNPIKWAVELQNMGAGELLINNIDKDGTQTGYDVELIKSITTAVDIPVIACGGAQNIQDLINVVKIGQASAAAAGSLFVFHGKHRAVLINFPKQEELKPLWN